MAVEEPEGNIVGEPEGEAVEGPEGDPVKEAVGELAVGVSVSDSKGKTRYGTDGVAVAKPEGDVVGKSSSDTIFGIFGGHDETPGNGATEDFVGDTIGEEALGVLLSDEVGMML